MTTNNKITDYTTSTIINARIGMVTPYTEYKLAQSSYSNRKIDIYPHLKIFERNKNKRPISQVNNKLDLFLEGGKIIDNHHTTSKQSKTHSTNWNSHKIKNYRKLQSTSKCQRQCKERQNCKENQMKDLQSQNLFKLISNNEEKTSSPSCLPKQFQMSSEMPRSREFSSSKERGKIIFSTRKNYQSIRTKINSEMSHKCSLKKQTIQPEVVNRIEGFNNNNNRPMFYLDSRQTWHIKAESYIVTEYPSGQIIFGNYHKKIAEIASLTKIMTFYAIHNISERFGRNINQQKMVVDEEAQAITGTSAQLFSGDQYTIEELLYGLMLPSGNDAAICLAKWGGNILEKYHQTQKEINRRASPTKIFVNYMNKLAQKIKMNNSKFMNPHGLPNNQSFSNPEDLAILVAQCLKIPIFRTVIKTKRFQCWVQHKGVKHQVVWENTNKLLRREHFIGGKTGVTISAGPCLASCYELDDKILITILLRTTKLSRRFKQTRFIIGLALSKLNRKQYSKRIKQILQNDLDLDSDNSEEEEAFNYDRTDLREMAKRNKILTFQM